MSVRIVLLAACLAGSGFGGQAAAQAQAQAQAPKTPAAPRADKVDAASDAIFKAWDSDHDGKLSPAEFRAGMPAYRRRLEAAAEVAVRLREQFNKVDANRNGGIDAGEYGNLVLVHEAGKGAPALATFDRNGDGRLEFAEYLALVGRLAPAQRAKP